MNSTPNNALDPMPKEIQPPSRVYDTTEIVFHADDGTPLFGKLTTPISSGRYPVVVWVQTAEAQTVDTRVQISNETVIEYFALYRECLAEIDVAFFSYEGRGVRSGLQPPRYVDIDRTVFNTSTLENKVLDAMAAVRAVQQQASIDSRQIYLMGSSEGTLLAAETATRLHGQIRGVVLQSVLTELREALKFQVTDGAFMQHCLHWDVDNDGIITRQEFETDPKGIRRLLPGVEFEVFDPNGDGQYTIEDRRQLSKPVTDAIEAGNTELVNAWLKPKAAVALPDGWLEDHFNHSPMWTFLSQLDIPVGIFQGEADFLTPAEGVRMLEYHARQAEKKNIEFQYYPGFGHNLGAVDYFCNGVISQPISAMFEFIKKAVRS